MTDWLNPLIELASKQIDKNKQLVTNKYNPIYIYGTGTFAQDVYHVLLNRGFPIEGFIDHLEKDNPSIHGIKIFTPESAANARKASEALVVLGLHNYQAHTINIIDRLRKAGFNNILTSTDIYDLFGSDLGTRYWLTSREYYFSLAPILYEMHSRLHDENSKEIFRSVIKFRLTGDTADLPEADLINPYHPTDLPNWKMPLRFVDCGAFDGDTIKDFLKNKIAIQAVAAFEPDLSNYAKLSNYISSHKTEISEANIFPCGVYSSTKQFSFETGQGMASSISNKGTTVIQCVALDDAIPTFDPNLIKMDIEGAEYDALLGARRLIAEHTPGIAASLYHRPEHLWQLPMLIESIAPGKYNFHMRSHAMNDFELVLYAMPKENQ